MHKGHQLLVTEQSEVEFQIGRYQDKVTCDIIPMDVCHVLLGRRWKFDRKVVHDGSKNCYKFEMGGIQHTLIPLQEGNGAEKEEPKNLVLNGKKFLQHMTEEEVSYAIVWKPRIEPISTVISDFPVEIKDMLEDYQDIVVDDLPNELPSERSISHHIDPIPGAGLWNKVIYRMTPTYKETSFPIVQVVFFF